MEVLMKKFLIALAALAVAACASNQTKTSQASAASPKEGELSPVGVIPTTLLHDAQRNKDLDISIEYPTRGGPSPVIILSHTYGMTNRLYEALVSNWTGHGYVVIRPAHADAGALRPPQRDVSAPMPPPERQSRGSRSADKNAKPQPPPFRAPLDEEIWDKQREPQWRDRARDITLIIDSLPGLEDKFPELKGKMDHAKIGVAGHAYGAFTALLLAGMKPDNLSIADSRVGAVLAMSPEGVSASRELTAESFRDIRIPVMFMTGSGDYGATENETPEWRKTAYENSAAGDKYFVLIQQARHSTFTGMSTPYEAVIPQSPMMIPTGRVDPMTGQPIYIEQQQRGNTSYIPERSLFDRIRSIGLTFFDAYLKSDTKAKEKLTEGQFGSNVTTEKK
jgi:predicted dienelactone hydrolase